MAGHAVARRLAAPLVSLAFLAAAPGTAQDRPLALPAALSDRNVATDAARALKAEIDALSAATPSAQRDARVGLRRLSFDLIFHGASAQESAQAMAIAGLRLHAARAAVDASIERAAAAGDAARALLAEFAARTAHGLDPLPPANAPEASLAPQLRPLEEAVALAESGAPAPPSGAWPAARVPADGGHPDAADADQATPESRDLATIESFHAELVPAAVRPAAAHALDRARAAVRACEQAGQSPGAAQEERAAAAADLRRLAAIQGWVDLIGSFRPGSRAAFQATCAQWAAALRDPARSAAARQTMDSFAREAALATPDEFECRLRTGDELAVSRCAGLSASLLEAIDRAREAWAARWASAGPSGADGARLFRVLAAACSLDLAGRMEAMPAAVAGLGAWGGMAAEPTAARPHPRALAARAALAAEAVLAGRDRDADADLARLEAEVPVAAVLAEAARAVGTWAAARSGPGCALVAARDAPGPGSYLGKQRPELMLFSRLLMEEAGARARGLATEAEELRIRAAGVARSLAGGDPAVARIGALRAAAGATAAGPRSGTSGVRGRGPR